MHKKVILGLTLSTPLSAIALNLQGTNIYSDEVNIPTTAGAGIIIEEGSNTTFEQNVSINSLSNNMFTGISGNSDTEAAPSKTIFENDLTINLRPDNMYGSTAINLSGPNTVTVNGKTTLDASFSQAIEITDNSSLILNGGADINGRIEVTDNGKLELNDESIINGNLSARDKGKISINSESEINGDLIAYAEGEIILNGDSVINGELSAEGEGKIILNGDAEINSELFYVSDNGEIQINGDYTITGELFAMANGKINLESQGDSVINGNITIEEDGRIQIKNQSKTTINGEISIMGENSSLVIDGESEINDAISSFYEGEVIINGKSKIDGNLSSSSEGVIILNGESEINGEVNVRGQGLIEINNKSKITKDITVEDENSLLLITDDSEIDANIFVDDKAKIEINKKAIINGSIHAEDEGEISLNGDAEINGSIVAEYNGKIEINNDSIISGYIFAHDEGGIQINKKAQIIGAIETFEDGKVELNLDSGSKMQLGANNHMFDDERTTGGTINIALAKNASWDITNSKTYITELSGNGNIKFADIHYSDSFGELTVMDLKGGANFDIRTNIYEEQNDKIIVTNSAEGAHTINVNNNGASNTNGQEKLILVEIDNNALNTATFKTTHDVELGGYVYSLNRDGNNWVLTGSRKPIDPPVTPDNPTTPVTPDDPVIPDNPDNPVIPDNPDNPVTPDNPDNPVTPDNPDNPVTPDNPDTPVTPDNPNKPVITTTANASAGFLNGNYLMSYVETQTLLKRLGDMRNSGKFGDVWMRGFSGKLDSFAGGKLSKFDMSYHGFQFGADKQLSEDSPFVVGAFVGQTYGSPNYRKGDGSLRSFNTGLYTTYLGSNGFYIDVVGKYARQRNHFKVKDTANNRVQGTGHTNGLGLSMELGKKFNFNEFYIEPQTQLSYSHQNGASINATNGLRVKLSNYNSLIGRASTLFGYEINTENSNINLYAKTGIVSEFNGDTYYKLNNSKENHSFKGSWWNNGVGISANINQRHTIYFDLESSSGHKFDLLQVNGGYRYSF
ncbi:autotransporter outer membrane beta-barrel domain-containing protein [Gilliamella sp. wkB112]|uniref:autotransporter outer membrane beta-barrel domain-containing protein n=1 Tax=Gilliamella sp. wkB112 TaxID=3120257 RepID=UPI00080E1AB8|nr:autotransporter outer membrane beta-barrel domain-containing protein [Gilliamella apicola]OCG01232.1 hypothetical protein A9G12_01360 [Gilliamella apicola]